MSTLTFNAKDLELTTVDELQVVLSKHYEGSYEEYIKGLVMDYWTPEGKEEGLKKPAIVFPWWGPCV